MDTKSEEDLENGQSLAKPENVNGSSELETSTNECIGNNLSHGSYSNANVPAAFQEKLETENDKNTISSTNPVDLLVSAVVADNKETKDLIPQLTCGLRLCQGKTNHRKLLENLCLQRTADNLNVNHFTNDPVSSSGKVVNEKMFDSFDGILKKLHVVQICFGSFDKNLIEFGGFESSESDSDTDYKMRRFLGNHISIYLKLIEQALKSLGCPLDSLPCAHSNNKDLSSSLRSEDSEARVGLKEKDKHKDATWVSGYQNDSQDSDTEEYTKRFQRNSDLLKMRCSKGSRWKRTKLRQRASKNYHVDLDSNRAICNVDIDNAEQVPLDTQDVANPKNLKMDNEILNSSAVPLANLERVCLKSDIPFGWEHGTPSVESFSNIRVHISKLTKENQNVKIQKQKDDGNQN